MSSNVSLNVALFACLYLTLCACTSQPVVDPHTLNWELDVQYQLGIPEPSGLTYDPDLRSLWTVSDRTGQIYQLSFEGEVLNTLPWVGTDPEGITLADGQLYVAEEQSGEVVVVTTTGEELERFLLVSVGAETNSGLEGIAYDPESNTLTVIREKDPTTWIELDLDGNEQIRRILSFADDYSGMTLSHDSTFWVVSDESKTAYRVSQTGVVFESFETGIRKAEGIACVNDTLYMVSDSEAELYRFVKR